MGADPTYEQAESYFVSALHVVDVAHDAAPEKSPLPHRLALARRIAREAIARHVCSSHRELSN